MKFTAKPGDRTLQSTDEPEAVLIYEGIPDWVTRPSSLGGTRATVKHGFQGLCPCGKHEALILVLDAQHQSKELRVAECSTHGYLWHTA